MNYEPLETAKVISNRLRAMNIVWTPPGKRSVLIKQRATQKYLPGWPLQSDPLVLWEFESWLGIGSLYNLATGKRHVFLIESPAKIDPDNPNLEDVCLSIPYDPAIGGRNAGLLGEVCIGMTAQVMLDDGKITPSEAFWMTSFAGTKLSKEMPLQYFLSYLAPISFSFRP